MDSDTLSGRVDRLRSRSGLIASALVTVPIAYALLDAFGNLDFAIDRTQAFWKSSAGVTLWNALAQPLTVFVVGIAWVGYLLLRPAAREPKYLAVKRLLREAEGHFRGAATLPKPAVFAAMMLASTWKVISGRGVTWKGRVYSP